MCVCVCVCVCREREREREREKERGRGTNKESTKKKQKKDKNQYNTHENKSLYWCVRVCIGGTFSYACTYVHRYTHREYKYIYIYIYREREREREREWVSNVSLGFDGKACRLFLLNSTLRRSPVFLTLYRSEFCKWHPDRYSLIIVWYIILPWIRT